jgi:hypothetical protein
MLKLLLKSGFSIGLEDLAALLVATVGGNDDSDGCVCLIEPGKEN